MIFDRTRDWRKILPLLLTGAMFVTSLYQWSSIGDCTASLTAIYHRYLPAFSRLVTVISLRFL